MAGGYEPIEFSQVLQRSLLYVCTNCGRLLIGFVNGAWDGDEHAFVLSTTVRNKFHSHGNGSELLQKKWFWESYGGTIQIVGLANLLLAIQLTFHRRNGLLRLFE